MTKKLISFDDAATGLGLPEAVRERLVTSHGTGVPGRMSSVEITPLGSGVEPVSMIRGRLYGRIGSVLYVSDDAGATWSEAGTSPSQLVRLMETSDGEVVAITYNKIFKSSGWDTDSHTWVEKMTANAPSYFLPWALRGDGTVFITTEYAAGSGYPGSRYARASFDAGSTWEIIYDSEAIHGKAAADLSHVHGCEYDPVNDRLYVCEGHRDIAGIWHSDDRGATWHRAPGMVMDPAPTSLMRTTGGMVVGSDSSDAGLFGVTFREDGMDEALVKTYNWRTGVSSVPGFGIGMALDPDTGIVYCGFRVENANVPPTILGGTVAGGRMVFEWPDMPVTAYDDILNLVIPAPGVLLGLANIGGVRHLIRGWLSAPGAVSESVEDTGNVLTGSAQDARSVAVGTRSVTGESIRSVAVGVEATSLQDSVSVGHGAKANASTSVAVGSGANTAFGSTAVFGAGATSRGSNSVAVGSGAGASGSGTAIGSGVQAYTLGTIIGANASSPAGTTGPTAIGSAAEATNQSTAVGWQAKATAQQSTAVGQGATATHARSVALGRGSTTTQLDQVAIGARHMEIGSTTTNPAAPASGSARLYLFDTGDGFEMRVRFSNGTIRTLAADTDPIV